MAKRKKKVKLPQGCPRCGSPWTKLSGFIKCSNPACGHTAGSQRLYGLTAEGRRVTSKQVSFLGDSPMRAVDDEESVLPIAGRARELK